MINEKQIAESSNTIKQLIQEGKIILGIGCRNTFPDTASSSKDKNTSYSRYSQNNKTTPPRETALSAMLNTGQI